MHASHITDEDVGSHPSRFTVAYSSILYVFLDLTESWTLWTLYPTECCIHTQNSSAMCLPTTIYFHKLCYCGADRVTADSVAFIQSEREMAGKLRPGPQLPVPPMSLLSLCRYSSTNRRGRPLGRWEDRVKKYVSERGVRGNELEWARRECVDRKRWRSVCHSHPLEGRFQRERNIKAIDWLIYDVIKIY